MQGFLPRYRFAPGETSDRLGSSHRNPPDPEPWLPVCRPGTMWCPAASQGNDEILPMIIVLKPHPTPEVVQHVLERIEALGLTPHLSQGVSRTIIGVIGDEEKLQVQPLQAIPGVEQVVPILKPFKLASREFHQDDLVIEVKGVRSSWETLAMKSRLVFSTRSISV